jgi:hypothetical protein
VAVSRLAEIAATLVLIGTFAWAGTLKVGRPNRWRSYLSTYGLPRLIKGAAFLGVPWVELGIALALVLGRTAVGAGAAAVLVVLFSASILRARRLQQSDKLDCGCLGGRTARDYRILLLRNAALGVAALVLIASPPRDWQPVLSLSGPGMLAAALILLIGAASWAGWQILSHYQRLGATST